VIYPPNTDTARLVADSVRFRDVKYEFRDGHLIIWTKNDGVIAINFKCVPILMDELRDVAAVWGGVRT